MRWGLNFSTYLSSSKGSLASTATLAILRAESCIILRGVANSSVSRGTSSACGGEGCGYWWLPPYYLHIRYTRTACMTLTTTCIYMYTCTSSKNYSTQQNAHMCTLLTKKMYAPFPRIRSRREELRLVPLTEHWRHHWISAPSTVAHLHCNVWTQYWNWKLVTVS